MKLAIIGILWLLVAGFVLVHFWPHTPRSAAQWIAFILLAPPVYAIIEWLTGSIFSRKRGMAISDRKLSIARISIALPITVAILALSWLAASTFK